MQIRKNVTATSLFVTPSTDIIPAISAVHPSALELFKFQTSRGTKVSPNGLTVKLK